MTYADVIEAHRAKTIVHLANHFGVNAEHVQYMGEIESIDAPFYYLCLNHPVPPLGKYYPLAELPPIVELTQEFVYEDRTLNRRTTILAGKCPDCGNVLMAEAKYNPS